MLMSSLTKMMLNTKTKKKVSPEINVHAGNLDEVKKQQFLTLQN